MAELKVYFDMFDYNKRKNDCPDTMYSQKEVDKAIAELKTRHKYKRCLDKAEICRAKLGQYPSFGAPSREERQLERHEAQWLKLAKKFKQGVL